MHILDLFEKIRATNKKSEKIALLSANKNLPFLEKVIYLAHSPRVKFYIKAIPAYQSSGIASGLVSNYDFSLVCRTLVRQTGGVRGKGLG